MVADLVIKRVSCTDILDAEDLLKEYADECSIPEIGVICPQREIYAHMQSTGLMHSFGVFEEEKLVGFASILLFTLPHYGKKVANVESMFLAKSHRMGGFGLELMKEIEQFAKERGCSAMLYNARFGSALEKMLTRASNYERTNSVFLRSL